MCIGVGTPSRIIDLFNAGMYPARLLCLRSASSHRLMHNLIRTGALTSSKLERIVIDASHFDQKKRGIFDMRETQEPLVQLLNRLELKSRYGSDTGSVQILLY